jgi:hypothetical protein
MRKHLASSFAGVQIKETYALEIFAFILALCSVFMPGLESIDEAAS